MSTTTPNLALLKPDPTDLINVSTQLDGNFDILDARVTDRNLYSTKGDILVGTAVANTPARLPIGSEGTSPVARAGATNGMAFESILPIGSIIAHAGVSAVGYLLCDGSAYSRTVQAALFSVIGTTYGPGDGSTTFNVPDARGRTLIGSGTGVYSGATVHVLGTTGGEEKHTLLEAELASHNHTGATNTDGTAHGHSASTDSPAHNHGASTGGESANHTHNFPTTAGGGGAGIPSASNTSAGSWTSAGVSNDHVHNITPDSHSHVVTVNNATPTHSHVIQSDGSNTPHNIMQPFIAINYLIKAV